MELIVNQLNKLGLTTNEAKAYIALLPLKEAKASQIAAAAQIPRSKIYETMQSLHKKGFVEILPERVTKFKAVAFDAAIQYYMDDWKQKLEGIIKTKEKVSEYLKSVAVSAYKDEIGEFTIVKAKRMIYKKLESFLSAANKSVYLMINVSDLRRLFYTAREAAKRVEIHVLVPINNENKNLVKRWLRFADVHHYETQTQVKIAISDDAEVLVFQTNKPIALHSKDKQFTSLLKGFFHSAWEGSPLAKDKIDEIETGKPVEEVRNIRSRREIYNAIPELIDKTKKEILINTTPAGILRIQKFFRKKLDEAVKRGIKVRCLAPITKHNMEAARQLEKLGIEIRHVDRAQTIMSCFDNLYLLLIHVRKDAATMNSPEDYAIVTNQVSTVDTMCQMFENMWANSLSLEARIHELETGKPVEKVAILRGNETIYEATKDASKRAKQEICTISTEFSPERAVKYGTIDVDSSMANKGAKLRYIFPITEKNVQLIKKLMEFAEVRHVDFTPIRVRIIDDKTCFVRYGGEEFTPLSEQVCICSSASNYVSTMKSYFEHVWQEAVPAEERIRELETGKPVEKTELIKGVENVFDNVTDAMLRCSKNLVVCVTEYGVSLALQKRKHLFEELKKKGVRIRYITTITDKTLENAKELSKLVELRHFEIPLPLIVTDSECMLTYRAEKGDPHELIRSNVSGMVSRMREMAENIWSIAVPAEERIRQLEKGEPVTEVRYLRGRESIYQLIPRFISEAKRDMLWMTSSNGIKRIYRYLKPFMDEAIKRGVRIRCLTQVTPENIPTIRQLGIEVRHIDNVYAIADCYDNSLLTIMQIKEDTDSIDSPEDITIITNQVPTVMMVRQFLEGVWEKSIDAETKMRELETGVAAKEFSLMIKNPDEGFQQAVKLVSSAKKSLCISTTATGLKKLLQFYPFDRLQGVEIKILCPVTAENASTVKEAIGFAEVRHVSEAVLRATIVDDSETIVVLKKPGEPYSGSVHSNDKSLITSVKSFYNSLWDSATDARIAIEKIATDK